MRSRFLNFAIIAMLTMVSLGAMGQNAPRYQDHGAFEAFSLSTSHDSSLGWTTGLDSAIGYDFNRAFSVDAGVPLYLVSASTTTTSGTGSTTQTTHYNSLGDIYVGLSLHPKFNSFAFSVGLVGTAPTGNRDNGISTGRATGTLGGRIEKNFDRITPFLEGTLGNSLGSTTRFHRPFTTLGAVSTFTGGASIDLTKKISFEASAYDVLPFGDQKVYSHNVGQANANRGRSFEQAAVTSGSASLTTDHGFSGQFGISPTKRVEVDAGYTRSIAYALDTYSAEVSFRLGHIAGDKRHKQ